MLSWRLKAQTFKKSANDPDYDAHHAKQTVGKSVIGTLFRPGSDLCPTVTIAKKSVRDMVKEQLDILDLMACNWVEFYNKSSLVFKYVKFVLFLPEMYKTYATSPFKEYGSCQTGCICE
jgi:hypothetical protein